jgi:hypothetical protein
MDYEDIQNEIINNILNDEKIIMNFLFFIFKRCKYSADIRIDHFLETCYYFWKDYLPMTDEKEISVIAIQIINKVNNKYKLWRDIYDFDKIDDDLDSNKNKYLSLNLILKRKLKLNMIDEMETK